MYVRVIKKRLSTGHMRGDIVPGSTFKQLGALLRNKAVAEVMPPPLTELAGWSVRAVLLTKHGITDAVQFAETPNHKLREIFNHKTDRAIERYKAEVRRELLPSRIEHDPRR